MKLLTALSACFLLFANGISAAEKLVFSCDFSNGYKPQVSVQPFRLDPSDVQIVDINGKKSRCNVRRR